MAKRERLFLLDGMALAYRAYFTFISRPLINSKGENTSAIFGFVNTLTKILDDEKPDHIAVVFDTPEPTFRHRKFEAYKATRDKMPEAMAGQMEKLKEVVEAFNVPIIEVPGYEADDVMGTLARQAEVRGIETYLVTGDKDFMQLVSPLTKIYKPGKRGDEWEIIDEEGVERRYGAAPNRVIDILGLMGDKSDNVPGIPGVGEATAMEIVKEFGTIEDAIQAADKIPKPALREKIQKFKDQALLSKELVTIKTDVPLNIDIEKLKSEARDVEKLAHLFTELEFKSLLRKLGASLPERGENISFDVASFKPLVDITTDEHRYHIVDSEDKLVKLCKKLSNSPFLVFDVETTSLNPSDAQLVGLSFAVKPGEADYVPLASENQPESSRKHSENWGLFDGTEQKGGRGQITENEQSDKGEDARFLNPSLVFRHLKPILENPQIKKCGQNVKFDILVLGQYGIEVQGVVFDTMVASYILRADSQHNLDSLAQEYLGYRMITFNDLVGMGKERVDIRQVPLEKVAEYSAQDADITLRLHDALKEKLEESRMLKLCEEVEFPLIAVLAEMERTGVALDVRFLAEMSKELELLLDNIVLEIYRLAGEKFNVNSTQQLSDILFNKLKLPIVRKTKTGYSTDVGVLETLRDAHPIVERLLEYRQLSKLKSTYVDALPKAINPATGRVHTSFNQTGTATGRLSSSDPNLQNIPMHTELGREIRKAFVPGFEDGFIMSADYSQIELRVMAHISQDKGLIEAFRNGEDIHASTAAKLFGTKPNEVTPDMRRRAKEVNFGIMYGIGPFGLASRLDISQAEAKEIIQKYFERFPKVNQYIFDTIAKARRDGYVSTLLGRRRYLPDINSRNQTVRANAERQAINMPIQGTAADMIKVAMIGIHSEILRLRRKDAGRRLSTSLSAGRAVGPTGLSTSTSLPYGTVGRLDRVVDHRVVDDSSRFKSRMILQVHDELVFEVEKKEMERMKKLVVEKMKKALPLDVPIEVDVGVGKNWYDAH